MTDLLRAELLKVRTTRTFFALAGAAAGLTLLLAVLIAAIDGAATRDDARDLLVLNTTAFFVLMLGAIGITGEWRHRTITSSLLAAPDRRRFLLAKVLAYAAAGALLAAAITLAAAVVAAAILSSGDHATFTAGDALEATWRNAAAATLLGGFGVAAGSVLRNQVGTIVTLLVMAFMVEPAVLALSPDVGAVLPVTNAPAGITFDFAGEGEESLLPAAAGAAVELAWIAGLAALGALLLRRRDL
ncbi:MAG TPA: hypothetical protein VHF51_07090 [Solirubrobacteraceae bacterium]|nr:hypothetical protein [Solirubrobacteraceae bacterium]